MQPFPEVHVFLNSNFWALYPLLAASLALFHRAHRHGLPLATGLMLLTGSLWAHHGGWVLMGPALYYAILPGLAINALVFLLVSQRGGQGPADPRFRVRLKTQGGRLVLANIRRGVSIIGSAGSGKTESVVLGLLRHFKAQGFCGLIHDYKHFELTELAYPLFGAKGLPFHIIAFDTIYQRVNPIAPRYLPDEESVNELSRVLLENLLEQKETLAQGSTKFFNDAVEGLIGGMIWMLRTHHPQYCTLPHLIALYQQLPPIALIDWLSGDPTARALAHAFICGRESERQTAAVLGTLSNALKKISTQKIFMVLSADGVDLDINHPDHPSLVCIVNHPRYETAYSPIIATLVHTITKQMAVRGRRHSFLLLEEAPTIRLLNMHRIPATLRSYDISTVYVMQDKAQNDMMYGEKASRAILSNLSYQFFGKANDPDTAGYYERFFAKIEKPVRSISKKADPFSPDTRITKGQREVGKVRSEVFFRLGQGEFIAFSDGRDRRVRFPLPRTKRELPQPLCPGNGPQVKANFQKIHQEIGTLIRGL